MLAPKRPVIVLGRVPWPTSAAARRERSAIAPLNPLAIWLSNEPSPSTRSSKASPADVTSTLSSPETPSKDPWASVFKDVGVDSAANKPSSTFPANFFSSRQRISTSLPPSSRTASTSASSPSSRLPPTYFRSRRPFSTSVRANAQDGRSAFDDLMDDINLSDVAPIPARRISPTTNTTSRGQYPAQRLSMTTSESYVMQDIFQQVFDKTLPGSELLNQSTKKRDPLSDVGIGVGKGMGRGSRSQLESLFGRTRRVTGRGPMQSVEASKASEEIERLRLEMDLIENDRELLEWAGTNIFGVRRDESSSTQTSTPPKAESFLSSTTSAIEDEAPSTSTSAVESAPSPTSPSTLDPSHFSFLTSIYPHVLTTLLAIFRDKFNDPHLTLAVFQHARYLSVPSYVYGCTTSAYNELLTTRWVSFRDIQGIVDTLREMRVNGLRIDGRTRQIVSEVRTEVARGLRPDVLVMNEDDMGPKEEEERRIWGILDQMDTVLRSFPGWDRESSVDGQGSSSRFSKSRANSSKRGSSAFSRIYSQEDDDGGVPQRFERDGLELV